MHRQRQSAHLNNHHSLTMQHVDSRLHLHRMSLNYPRQLLELVTLNLLVTHLTSILQRFGSAPRRLHGFLKTRLRTTWLLRKQQMFCPFLSVPWKRRSYLWPLAFLSQCAYAQIIAALISFFALNLLSAMAEADRINSLRLWFLYQFVNLLQFKLVPTVGSLWSRLSSDQSFNHFTEFFHLHCSG